MADKVCLQIYEVHAASIWLTPTRHQLFPMPMSVFFFLSASSAHCFTHLSFLNKVSLPLSQTCIMWFCLTSILEQVLQQPCNQLWVEHMGGCLMVVAQPEPLSRSIHNSVVCQWEQVHLLESHFSYFTVALCVVHSKASCDMVLLAHSELTATRMCCHGCCHIRRSNGESRRDLRCVFLPSCDMTL